MNEEVLVKNIMDSPTTEEILETLNSKELMQSLLTFR
jgi:hypothetical protein